MELERFAARLMAMDDRAWARHANPWSVWTRFATLPFLLLAGWSRVWLGPWFLVPLALLLVWLWLNPRLFGPPDRTDGWAAKATFGERVWIARARLDLPAHFRRVPPLLNAVSGLGLALAVWGVIDLAPWPTITGTVLVYAGKVWFLDRMVWLYDAYGDRDPEWRAWLREG